MYYLFSLCYFFYSPKPLFQEISCVPIFATMFQTDFPSFSVTKIKLFPSSVVSFPSAKFHNFCSTSRFPTYVALCQAVHPSLSVTNSILFLKFSFVSFSLAQFHNFCNTSRYPSLAAQCQAIFPLLFVTNNNLQFMSSVSFSYAHSHCCSSISRFLSHAAKCQAVIPSLSVANNNFLFTSSVVSFP